MWCVRKCNFTYDVTFFLFLFSFQPASQPSSNSAHLLLHFIVIFDVCCIKKTREKKDKRMKEGADEWERKNVRFQDVYCSKLRFCSVCVCVVIFGLVPWHIHFAAGALLTCLCFILNFYISVRCCRCSFCDFYCSQWRWNNTKQRNTHIFTIELEQSTSKPTMFYQSLFFFFLPLHLFW